MPESYCTIRGYALLGYSGQLALGCSKNVANRADFNIKSQGV